MVHKRIDFRSLLLEILAQLEREDVSRLALYFKLGRATDAIKLLHELENLDIINPADITQLIEAFKLCGLHNLNYLLEEYQTSVDNEPTVRNSAKFAGRSCEIKKILVHLTDNEISSNYFRAVYVSGMAGVGKTFLTEEVIRLHSLHGRFEKHFISCRGMKSTTAISEILKEELNMQSSLGTFNFKVVEKKLKHGPARLIVLDNVEDLMKEGEKKFDDFLTNFINAGKRVKKNHCLLVTSRKRLSQELFQDFKPHLLWVQLDRMTMSDSEQLLRRYLGKVSLAREEIRDLATLCGQHPLAMALVASRLKHSPMLNVDILASAMRKEPLATLRDIEELQILDTCSYIEGTFEQTFVALMEKEQEALVILAAAPHDIKTKTALDVSGFDYKDFHEIACRLLSLNLITVHDASDGSEATRYSMHLLTRHFVRSYCRLEECPRLLRKAHKKATKRLLEEYSREMSALMRREFSNPSSYSEAIKKERCNYLPLMSEIFDYMISSGAAYDVVNSAVNILPQVMLNPQGHMSFLDACLKKVRRLSGPMKVQVFFELHHADCVLQSGKISEAKQEFNRLENILFHETTDLREIDRRQLQTLFLRLYGRYLASVNSKEALRESAWKLQDAIKSLTDESLFQEEETRQRDLALAHYDLGNTYFELSRVMETNQLENIRNARKQYKFTMQFYEKCRRIFGRGVKRTPRLFDTYLSIANCDVELLLLDDLTPGQENAILVPALKLFSEAESVASEHGQLIKNNPSQMYKFYYSRAMCHYRSQKYTEAAADAEKALKMMKQVSRAHSKILPCLVLLGQIYDENTTIPRRGIRAFMCYKRALAAAYKRFQGLGTSDRENLELLEFNLMKKCESFGRDPSHYEDVLEAIRRNDPLADVNVEFSGISSSGTSSSDENDDQIYSERRQTRQNFENAADSDFGNAPSSEVARQLASELDKLIKGNLQHLQRTDVVETENLILKLDSEYDQMENERKLHVYDEAMGKYRILKQSASNPALDLRKRGGDLIVTNAHPQPRNVCSSESSGWPVIQDSSVEHTLTLDTSKIATDSRRRWSFLKLFVLMMAAVFPIIYFNVVPGDNRN